MSKPMPRADKYKYGARSKQTVGVLTEAQTRDARYRAMIKGNLEYVEPNTHWYVLRISAANSLRVGAMLARRGILVGLPERKAYVKVNGFVSKRRYRYERPLNGYMFIGVNPGVDALVHLYRLSLIHGIMGRNGEPYRFDPMQIAGLYERLHCGQFDGQAEALPRYWDVKPGMSVAMKDGTHQTQTLKVLDIAGRFAHVTGYFFGRECRMQVPLSALVRID